LQPLGCREFPAVEHRKYLGGVLHEDAARSGDPIAGKSRPDRREGLEELNALAPYRLSECLCRESRDFKSCNHSVH